MKRIIIIILKIFGIFTGLLVVVLVVIIAILAYLNSSNKINGVAQKFLNHYADAEMTFEDLKLDFSHFPVVRLTANNGLMISHLHKFPTDTLAKFKHLDAEMDSSYLLADSLTVYIPRVEVVEGFALADRKSDG